MNNLRGHIMNGEMPSSSSLPCSPAHTANGGGGGSKYILNARGPVGSDAGQQAAAAAFFARARTRQASNAIVVDHGEEQQEQDLVLSAKDPLPYNFSSSLSSSPPVPPALLKRMSDDGAPAALLGGSVGKVRVVLRVADKEEDGGGKSTQHFVMDKKKRQVTLLDPSNTGKESNSNVVSAPKMFAFDGLFSTSDPQSEVSASALSDPLHGAVVQGQDGCLFCFGHAGLGKTRTMVGVEEDPGVMPTALSWAFKCVAERKEKSNARFAVRASALEVASGGEEVRDLLSDMGEGCAPPSALFPKSGNGSGGGGVMHNLTEVRCPTAEKAAKYLDVALSRRKRRGNKAEGGESHFVFTLHLYQYSDSKTKSQARNNNEKTIISAANLCLFFSICYRRVKTLACLPAWLPAAAPASI